MSRASSKMRRAATLGLPAVLASGIAAFFPPIVEAAPPTPVSDTGAPVPTLDFQPCGQAGASCATATVPLDYDDPTGETISLLVSMAPATDQVNKIGTLFLNVGGPGGPTGQEVRDGAAVLFSDAIRQRFDIIGFDPRGVGESTPIRCFASADERSEFFATEPQIPLDREQVEVKNAINREYGERCAANAGPLLEHMSTANVARDMDLLRAAVGDEQLTYVGLSYGTHLGSVYANLFPDRVRAIALDGNLDAVGWSTGNGNESRRRPFDTRIQSATGAAATLDAFLAECARAGAEVCPLATDGDPAAKWEELRARLRAEPLVVIDPATGEETTFTYDDLVGLTISTLYSPPSIWGALAGVLENVYTLTNVPAAIGELESMAVTARGDAGFAPGDPFDDSFSAVTCSETDNPTDPRAWERNARREERQFGAGGEFWAWGSLACATWPVKDDDRYAGPYDTPTANPILLVNHFFDPATSFESAVELQAQLADAQLLPVAGYGHVTLGESVCVDNALASYLIDQQLPPADLLCEQDIKPFDPPPAAPAAPGDAAATDLEPAW